MSFQIYENKRHSSWWLVLVAILIILAFRYAEHHHLLGL